MKTESAKGKRRMIRKAAGVVAGAALVLLAAAALLLAVRPARERILSEAIRRVDRRFPGSWSVESRWPALGTIDIGPFLWIDGADTLASAERIRVAADPTALMRGKLHFHMIRGSGIRADFPAIGARIPSGGEDDRGDEGWEAPPLRVDEFEMDAPFLRLTPERSIRLSMGGGRIDLTSAERAAVRIDTLAAESGEGAWRAEAGAVIFGLGKGAPEGRIHLRFAAGPEIRLALLAREEGRFRVEGALAPGPAEPRSSLVGNGILLRREGRIRGVRFDGIFEAPAGASPLRPAGRPFPPAPVALHLEGEASFAPERLLRLSGDWIPGGFVRGGGFAVRAAGNDVDLDSLVVRVDGASVAIAGSMREGGTTGRAVIRQRGEEAFVALGLDSLLAGVEDPWIEATARMDGEMDEPLFEAEAALGAVVHGTPIDTVRARLNGQEGWNGPVDVHIHGRALRRILDASLRVRHSNGTLEMRVEPVLIRLEGTSRPVPPPGVGAGSIRRNAEGEWRARDFALVGEPGFVRLDGERSSAGVVDFRVAWEGREPLPALLRSAGARGKAAVDSLRNRWEKEGPFHARLAGRVSRAGEAWPIRAEGDLRLPGPSILQPTPSGSAAAPYGPVEGRVRVFHSPGTGADVRLDLGATGWLDTALVHAVVEGERVTVDTARVSLDGVHVDVQGTKNGESWEAEGRFALENPARLRPFLPGLPEDLELSLEAEGRSRGDSEGIEGNAAFRGRLAVAGIEAPGFDGSIRLAPEGLGGMLRFGDGFLGKAVWLDTLRASLDRPAGGYPRVRLDAAGGNISLRAAAEIRKGEETVLEADTLDLVLGGRDLRAGSPFQLRMGRNAITVEGLRMSGGLGSLEADGTIQSPSSDLALRVDLDLPGRPDPVLLPDALWPRGIFLSRRESADGTQEAEVVVRGLSHAGRLVDGILVLQGDSTGARMSVVLAEKGDTLFSGEGRIPVTLASVPPRFAGADSPIRLRGEFRGFPLLTGGGSRGGEGGAEALLNGTVRLEGTARRPVVDTDLVAVFPGVSRFAGRRLSLTASFGETGRGKPDAGDGLRAEAVLLDGDRSLFRGELDLPVRWEIAPVSVRPGEGEMTLRVASEEFQLSDLSDWLPPSFSLDGFCSVRLEAKGNPRDPSLDGRLDVRKLFLAGMGGSRVEIDGGATVGGTGRAPSAKGDFEVRRGVLRVPEEQKALLPVEGEALLWRLARDSDSGIGPAPPEEETIAGETNGAGKGRVYDLDIGVRIPSGFWIRGRGLEVELNGELRLLQKGEYPTIAGELQAKRGSLVLLGRAFRVESGMVTFFGDDEADPSMNLVLAARVEGMIIRVLIGGTVRRPELNLRSEPEMSEGDILSVLLFGRVLDDLDHDQMLLVQRRAGEVAAHFGAARLGARLSRDLGVDLVTLSDGQGRNGGRSLVIGKYLSRKILLRYEQPIEGRSALYVALEYFLTGRLRVETLFGHRDQSALGLGWGKDY